jgi:hypothetical protein
MTKQGSSIKGTAKSLAKRPIGVGRKNRAGRDTGTGEFVAVRGKMVEAVMAAAERSGLLNEKGRRIGGRVSPVLVRQAKAQTGIKTDTDLIEFALASVALEDRFAESFKAVRGAVDPDLKLGF